VHPNKQFFDVAYTGMTKMTLDMDQPDGERLK
jgi:hypothetical protein